MDMADREEMVGYSNTGSFVFHSLFRFSGLAFASSPDSADSDGSELSGENEEETKARKEEEV